MHRLLLPTWIAEAALLKPEVAPLQCRWCSSNGFDDAARDLRWSNLRTADATSDILSYVAAPVAAAALVAVSASTEGRPREIIVDALMVAEVGVATGLIGDLARWATGRERPTVDALPEEEKPNTDRPAENNLSFFSGHAATAVALAVSSGTVATLRKRRLAPVVWATGLTLAAATSYLRIASDEHYATDVLAGVLVGAAIGAAVPLLHRPRDCGGASLAAAPVPGGAVLTLVFHE